MYPFKNENVFLRNAWYVAGYSTEIDEKPFERTIMDLPIVFFRTESGEPAAMHAMCPHRYYPLALHGKVVGEAIVCHYHGYMFDGKSGSCVRAPSAPNAPQNFKQRVYPVVERGPYIWIWPGDAHLVDYTKLPSEDQLKLGKDFAISPMQTPVLVNGRYMLGLENLMDLTHVAFLHGAHGNSDDIVTAPLVVTEEEDVFTCVRPMRIGWTDVCKLFYSPDLRYDGFAEADNESIMQTPGYFTNTAHTPRILEGHGPLDPKVYGEVWFHHALTPATKHSTHYFGTQSRSHRLDDEAFGVFLYNVDTKIRSEDIEAMEEIERRIVEFGPPQTELMTRSDAAAGRLRRRFQRAIDREVQGNGAYVADPELVTVGA